MARKIDYYAVNVCSNKDPKEYTFAQRRSVLLKEIIKAGHPGAISQRKWADKFGVSQAQIFQDMDVLAEYMKENAGRHAELMSESVYNNSIKKLQEEGKHKDAAQVVEMYTNWLFKSGRRRKEPEEVNITGKVTIEEKIHEFYEKSRKRNTK